MRTDEFLISRRAKVSPEQAGITSYGELRRVPGLRREEGIGPRENRPRRLDGAWHTMETNAFSLTNSWTGPAKPARKSWKP